MKQISQIENKEKNINCLISGEQLLKILDFGMHPYADTFIPENLVDKSEPVFPLEVYLNPNNGNIQLGCVTNDFDRYNLYDYSYTSSNSNFSKTHWRKYKDRIVEKFNPVDKFIIEVGSNDGFLLGMFSESNSILGVDSSKQMVDVANSNGVRSIHRIFNTDTANEIKSNYGLCDILIANNVFNHSNNPVDFATGVSNILNTDGVFVFELPYWFDTVRSGKFDQVYHEHISYFTVNSAYHLLKKANLEIFDVELVDYHGGSIRVYSRKSSSPKMNPLVKKLIDDEVSYGLFNSETYVKWQKELELKRNQFLSEIFDLKIKNPNSIIIGVGAAAKANTFLNYYRIDKSILNYITDSSEYKIGKLTPLSRIPIVSDDIFSEFDDVYAMILSWNISQDLIDILKKINPKIKFIKI
jgi:2-polyprenyl-3-methyl-5-hydroxy-6-metoxy-1,4-benzoquinol methylase